VEKRSDCAELSANRCLESIQFQARNRLSCQCKRRSAANRARHFLGTDTLLQEPPHITVLVKSTQEEYREEASFGPELGSSTAIHAMRAYCPRGKLSNLASSCHNRSDLEKQTLGPRALSRNPDRRLSFSPSLIPSMIPLVA
jgi:hypothetical protein